MQVPIIKQQSWNIYVEHVGLNLLIVMQTLLSHIYTSEPFEIQSFNQCWILNLDGAKHRSEAVPRTCCWDGARTGYMYAGWCSVKQWDPPRFHRFNSDFPEETVYTSIHTSTQEHKTLAECLMGGMAILIARHIILGTPSLKLNWCQIRTKTIQANRCCKFLLRCLNGLSTLKHSINPPSYQVTWKDLFSLTVCQQKCCFPTPIQKGLPSWQCGSWLRRCLKKVLNWKKWKMNSSWDFVVTFQVNQEGKDFFQNESDWRCISSWKRSLPLLCNFAGVQVKRKNISFMASHPSKLKQHHPWLFCRSSINILTFSPHLVQTAFHLNDRLNQESPQQRSDSKLWFTSQLPVSKLEKNGENARFWVQNICNSPTPSPKKDISNTIGKDACKRSRTCSTKLSSYRIDRCPHCC